MCSAWKVDSQSFELREKNEGKIFFNSAEMFLLFITVVQIIGTIRIVEKILLFSSSWKVES